MENENAPGRSPLRRPPSDMNGVQPLHAAPSTAKRKQGSKFGERFTGPYPEGVALHSPGSAQRHPGSDAAASDAVAMLIEPQRGSTPKPRVSAAPPWVGVR